MKRVVYGVIALFAGASALHAQEVPSSVPADAASEMLWFVEVSGNKNAVRTAAANAGIEFEERFSYDTLWNGLSVRTTASQAAAMTALSGVVAVYPVDVVELAPHAEAGAPDLVSALYMSGANIAQQAGFDGTGVKVGVIDSGIDYHHPDLGGCFGPGCRVAVGFDFVGDGYAAGVAPAVPDNDPDDCQGPANLIPGLTQSAGHGTHVAGIVGASGDVAQAGARGAAPGVTFGAYRVFGCSGSTSSDIMLAAMERAYADGMDVVNMSIGSGHQWPQYPTAVAADALVERGVVVVASIGNSGSTGLYAGGAPGVGAKVIGVASVNNTHSNNQYFTVPGGAVPYNPATGAPPPPTNGTASLARTGTAATLNDACNALPAGSLAGKVALIQRGTCSFHIKSLNAENAGAIGAVIYNNTTGLQSITVAGTPAITIPVVSITQGAGLYLDGQLAAGSVTITWQEGFISQPAAGGGTTSSFSSYGLAPDLSMKPDVTGPGGAIRSTYPLGFGSGYAVLGGTSMSSPHVAGNVAQLLQSEPGLAPADVLTRLQNTAQPVLWWGNPGLGFLDNVHRQGAGHVRIDRAIGATSRVSPARLPLGESVASGRHKMKLDVSNSGTEAVTYAVHHEPALATSPLAHSVTGRFGPFQFGFYASLATLDAASSVTVAAGGTTSVQVEVVEPEGLPDKGLYGGYVVFTPDNGGDVIRVPYAGFKGDYQTLEVLQPASNFAFPWLAQLVGTSYQNRPAGQVYTMVGNDIPFFLFHLAHQSRNLKMTVRAVGNNSRNWHSILDVDYMRRNGGDNPAALADSFYAVSWDGLVFNPSGKKVFVVPNGQYQVTITAQKALGNPSQTESWTSPVITIARP
ncbi:MAG: S8 family serine peptidase [Gammaproteobacteria bacterium]